MCSHRKKKCNSQKIEFLIKIGKLAVRSAADSDPVEGHRPGHFALRPRLTPHHRRRPLARWRHRCQVQRQDLARPHSRNYPIHTRSANITLCFGGKDTFSAPHDDLPMRDKRGLEKHDVSPIAKLKPSGKVPDFNLSLWFQGSTTSELPITLRRGRMDSLLRTFQILIELDAIGS